MATASAVGSLVADRIARRPLSARLAAIGRFEARALGIAALAVALLFAASPLTVAPARAAEPRVAIIVGPAGTATDPYRAAALAAASEASHFTSDVVTVLSPDATWPAAKAAMQGASIVVYLGHGNGFPSPYGSVAKPATQNGLGLNPAAGVDDAAHQYFGEEYLARQVHLAPHAVVLLHHLCYASGNGEPGSAEPDVATAEQRVDNYAAGWLAAGAEAVIADSSTSAGPDWYIRAILSGRGSIESIWRAAPSFHDHVIGFASERTPGMTGLMDPTKTASRFYRSLVTRTTLRAEEVARGAALVDRMPMLAAPVVAGPVVTGQRFVGSPVAGADLIMNVDLERPAPVGASIGIRWDRLTIVDPGNDWAPDGAPATSAPSAPTLPGTTGAAPQVDGAASPAVDRMDPEVAPPAAMADAPARVADAAAPGVASPAPRAVTAVPSAAPSEAPEPSPAISEPIASAALLVAPEVPGDVIRVEATRRVGSSLRATMAAPSDPGLYRLVVTLHDPDGVAYDPATQERIPALLVRVSAAASAAFGAPGSIEVRAGSAFRLPLAITNTGSLAWIAELVADQRLAEPTQPRGALLVGHWVRLGVPDRSAPPDDAVASVIAEPGATAQLRFDLDAPSSAGEYLLVLDVVSPILGSLTATGMPPVAIPVHVDPLPPGDPSAPKR